MEQGTVDQSKAALERSMLLAEATPEKNPVWVDVRDGEVVRSGLVGIDDPTDPNSGMKL